MAGCAQCNGSGCGGCGALTVPIGPTGPTGPTGPSGSDGADGTNGAPGYQVFSFTIGGVQPWIMTGSAAGKAAASIIWPGTTNYPATFAMARMNMCVYGTSGGPNYTVEIFDRTNGSALVASIVGATNTGVNDIVAMTFFAANFSTGIAVWEIFVTDNTATTDKVNIKSLTWEW